ncbi:MAG: LptF/LptG family permease [Spirochaetia bacterium]
MKTLHFMLLRSFVPIFLISLLFFVLTLEMVDVFANLWRYLNNDASIKEILQVSLLYLPTSTIYALPPALLFAVSFTLGNLYARNELIAILGAGFSFVKLIVPLFVIGILLSLGYFLFHEALVIDTFARKNQLSRELLGQKVSYSNSDITVIGETNNNVYHADYYNDSAKTLSGLTVLQRGANSRFLSRIEAGWAEFELDSEGEGSWILHEVNEYKTTEAAEVVHTAHERIDARFIELSPFHFQRKTKNVEELHYAEAREWIEALRKSGRSGYKAALTDYYKRFSFALTPFIVILISAAIGSRFKKNILLMSLMVSLILSVIYYVSDMILGLFAKQGIIEPVTGAWAAVLFFLAAGTILLKHAKT